MGMFVANGTAVAPQSVNGRLEDVAPTVLALLGAPIPAGMDGRPLVVAGTEAKVAGFPADPSGPAMAARDDSGYTAEEEEAVRRRLEALGYL
jgi:hypothetical protein